MKKKNRDTDTFSLSFLDAITCAFGAVILLLVLTKIYEPQIIERSKEQLVGLIAALQQEIFDMRGESILLDRRMVTVDDELTDADRLLSELRRSVAKASGEFATVSADSEAEEKVKAELLAARQSLTEEMQRLLADYKPPEADTTVGGIPVDSEYIIFIIDSSGSMKSGAWSSVVKTVEDTFAVYPNIKGFQVIDTDGVYLDRAYTDKWIPDSLSNRSRVVRGVKDMRQARNSSPRRGIQKAIETFYQPGLSISIFVLGDDFDEDRTSIQQLAQFIENKNKADESGKRLVRIHAVGFPVHVGQFSYRFIRFSHLMRTLCEQNGGTFVALSEAEGSRFRIQIGGREI